MLRGISCFKSLQLGANTVSVHKKFSSKETFAYSVDLQKKKDSCRKVNKELLKLIKTFPLRAAFNFKMS